MKQRTILLGSIFCVFLFCSLLYQPVIANQNRSSLLQQKEIKGSVESVKIQPNDVTNCGCNTPDEKFPIICGVLFLLYGTFDFLFLESWGYIWVVLMTLVGNIAKVMHCDWVSSHSIS
jgi:hypothetical protein